MHGNIRKASKEDMSEFSTQLILSLAELLFLSFSSIGPALLLL